MGDLSYGTPFSGLRQTVYKAGITTGTSGDACKGRRKRIHTGGSAWTTVTKGLDPGKGGLVRLQLPGPQFPICEGDRLGNSRHTGDAPEALCMVPGP